MTYLALRAPLELKSAAGSTKLPSKFSGTAYSGGIVPTLGVVIDLSTTRVTGRMPLLSDHDRARTIGVVEASRVSGGQLLVEGKLFSDMPDSAAEKLAQLAVRGAPFELSVGLYAFTEQVIPAGQNVTVNSRQVSGPVTVLRNGHIREISVVTLGADPDAKATILSSGRRLPSSSEALARKRRAAERA